MMAAGQGWLEPPSTRDNSMHDKQITSAQYKIDKDTLCVTVMLWYMLRHKRRQHESVNINQLT
jgi:hypothetical protein